MGELEKILFSFTKRDLAVAALAIFFFVVMMGLLELLHTWMNATIIIVAAIFSVVIPYYDVSNVEEIPDISFSVGVMILAGLFVMYWLCDKVAVKVLGYIRSNIKNQ